MYWKSQSSHVKNQGGGIGTLENKGEVLSQVLTSSKDGSLK